MIVYVLFVYISGYRQGAHFQYEFKDKAQCLNAGKNMEKHFSDFPKWFCQEVRK